MAPGQSQERNASSDPGINFDTLVPGACPWTPLFFGIISLFQMHPNFEKKKKKLKKIEKKKERCLSIYHTLNITMSLYDKSDQNLRLN